MEKLGVEAIREQQLNSVKSDVERQLTGRYGTPDNEGYVNRSASGVVYRRGQAEGMFDSRWQVNARLRYDSDVVVVDRVLIEDIGRDPITGELPDGFEERLLAELMNYGAPPLETKSFTGALRSYSNRRLVSEDFENYFSVKKGLVSVDPETGRVVVEAAPLNGNLFDVSKDLIDIMQVISHHHGNNITTLQVGEFEKGRYGLVLEFKDGLGLKPGKRYNDSKDAAVGLVSTLVNLVLEGRVPKPHLNENAYGMNRKVREDGLYIERPYSLEQTGRVVVESSSQELGKREEDVVNGVSDAEVVEKLEEADDEKVMQQLRITLKFKDLRESVGV